MSRIAPALLVGLLLAHAAHPAAASPDELPIFGPGVVADIADLRGKPLAQAQIITTIDSLDARPDERPLRQHSTHAIGAGDFTIRLTVVLDGFDGQGAGLVFDGGVIVLDDPEWGAVLTGRLFGGGRFPLETSRPANARPGAPIPVEVVRRDGMLTVRLDEFEMGRIGLRGFHIGRIGFDLGSGRMRVLECTVEGDVASAPRPRALFSSADGDIDEFREPSSASDGSTILVTAIAVTSTEDGSTRQEVHARFCRGVPASGTSLDASHRIALEGVDPDIACVGFMPGREKPWILLVQETAPRRLATRLMVYDSADGRTFTRHSEVATSEEPVQLLPGSLRTVTVEGSAPRLVAAATRVSKGGPQACWVEISGDGAASVRPIDDEPGCEPLWLSPTDSLVRRPREAIRDARGTDGRVEAEGFTGSAVAGWSRSRAPSHFTCAQAEIGFAANLRQLESVDGGKNWRPTRLLWGGASGHTCGARIGEMDYLVFEGGDKARREHVLILEWPLTEGQRPTDSK